MRTAKTLIRLGGCPGWSESLLGAQSFRLFSHEADQLLNNDWLLPLFPFQQYVIRLMTKPTKWPVRPAKTQISLGICPVWSESLLSAWINIGPLATHSAYSKDWSDWAHMPFCWFCHKAAHVSFQNGWLWKCSEQWSPAKVWKEYQRRFEPMTPCRDLTITNALFGVCTPTSCLWLQLFFFFAKFLEYRTVLDNNTPFSGWRLFYSIVFKLLVRTLPWS